MYIVLPHRASLYQFKLESRPFPNFNLEMVGTQITFRHDYEGNLVSGGGCGEPRGHASWMYFSEKDSVTNGGLGSPLSESFSVGTSPSSASSASVHVGRQVADKHRKYAPPKQIVHGVAINFAR